MATPPPAGTGGAQVGAAGPSEPREVTVTHADAKDKPKAIPVLIDDAPTASDLVVLHLHGASGGPTSKPMEGMRALLAAEVPTATIVRPEFSGFGKVEPRVVSSTAVVKTLVESGELSPSPRRWLLIGHSFGTRVTSKLLSDIAAWLPAGDTLVGGMLVSFAASDGKDPPCIREEPTTIDKSTRVAFIRGGKDQSARLSEFDPVYARVVATKRRWDVEAMPHTPDFTKGKAAAAVVQSVKEALLWLLGGAPEEKEPDAKRQKRDDA